MERGVASVRSTVSVPAVLALVLAVVLAGCEAADGVASVDRGAPAAPRNVDVRYFDRAVFVTWELSGAWNGESFRVYGKRVSDPDFFLIAEVTNCSNGLCSYTDTNIVAGVSYVYFVAAVDGRGVETVSATAVEIAVPQPVPPPVPEGVDVLGLDGATFVSWGTGARSAQDFSHYRVYLSAPDGAVFFLGESDSEGFLDLLVENGFTYAYFVSSVDTQGHESGGSQVASATPRPDFHNEWVWAHQDRPDLSGFRFQSTESTDPVVAGTSPSRHFRLERDGQGWWLVPGPDAGIFPAAFETTALSCGPAADAGCVALESAPLSGYVGTALEAIPQSSYALRVRGDDGELHYASIRITLLGFDQLDDGIMIFDWSYQLQPGNPDLAPPGG